MVTKKEAINYADNLMNYLCKESPVSTERINEAALLRNYLEGSKESASDLLTRFKPSVHEITVLDYIREKGSVTTADAMNLLGLSQTQANAVLRGLVSLDLLSDKQDSKRKLYMLNDADMVEEILKEYGGFSRYKSIKNVWHNLLLKEYDKTKSPAKPI